MTRLRHRWPRSALPSLVMLLSLVLPVFLPTAAHAASEGRIIGGAPVDVADHPWVVALVDTASRRAFCAGALVAPTKVMTAGHCAATREPRRLRVVAGRTDLVAAHTGSVARVSDAVVHPDLHTPLAYGHDVAVLTLDRPLPYPTLPWAEPGDESPYQPGGTASVFGWGRTEEDGTASTHQLRVASVPMWDDERCAAAYPGRVDRESMVCAGAGGADACQGDSGGPLVVDGRVVGLVSWGTGCGRPDRPGVYTRLSHLADWVDAAVRSA
ncbi:S1 family serine peptidase [Streptoalloteichus tenebrarius]|nr:serine protease [Streptoalloteichus tenebrarius]BFF03431.1 serine protease [Streptoalloteichus tenebrarius]